MLPLSDSLLRRRMISTYTTAFLPLTQSVSARELKSRSSNDPVVFPGSFLKRGRNGMDTIRNISASCARMQHMSGVGLASRTQAVDAPVQLCAEGYFQGMFSAVSRLREPREIYEQGHSG